jgi:DNA processing protein
LEGRGVSASCGECLKRAHLVGFLAPWIADRLLRREPLAPRLLSLADEELIAAVARKRTDDAFEFLDRFDLDAAWEQMARAGIEGICFHSTAYPSPLRDLTDPPRVLFTTSPVERIGKLMAEPAVAVVGARRCSGYAREVAYDFGRGLAAAGITVVSGLALGIDAEAHRGAMDAGGGAIAVLAGGADVPYPRTNRRLYERVRDAGAIVSELPPGIRPYRWGFPARNRIMAALARMTVIVEAAEKSGSLITAELASDLGRDVCAVPGLVTTRKAEGSNRLLHDGAPIVRGPADVLELIFGVGYEPAQSSIVEDLDPELRSVLDSVEEGDGVEATARETRLPAADVRAALGRLELLGLVAREGVGTYRRTARR